MISKTSNFSIKDKKLQDADNSKDYPTFADLMKEQNVKNYSAATVHRRRDLDSLDNSWGIDKYILKF